MVNVSDVATEVSVWEGIAVAPLDRAYERPPDRKEGEGEEDMEVAGDIEDSEMPSFDLLENDLDLSSVSNDSDSKAGLCFLAAVLDLQSDHCRGESREVG